MRASPSTATSSSGPRTRRSTLGVLVGYAAGKPLAVVGTAWLSRGDSDDGRLGAVAGARAGAGGSGTYGTCRSQTRILTPSWRHWPRRPPRSGRVLADARPAARAPGQAADGRSGVVRRPTRARRGALHRGRARARCGERIAQDGEGADRPRVGHAHVLRQRAPPPRRVRHGHSVAVRAVGGRAKLAAA